MKKPKSAISVSVNSRLTNECKESDSFELTYIQLVKRIYAYERSRWESIKQGSEVNYILPKVYDGKSAIMIDGELEIEKAKKSEWKTLADWIKGNKFPPKAFLATVFDNHLCTSKRALEPFQIRTDKYANLWYNTKDKMSERIKIALYSQRNTASREYNYKLNSLNKYNAWATVLLNMSLSLSPLFRYCIAMGIGTDRFQDLACRFEANAIMQFERYRKFYKEHWFNLLPRYFSINSSRNYPYLIVQ